MRLRVRLTDLIGSMKCKSHISDEEDALTMLSVLGGRALREIAELEDD